jgi:hypothetical protein
MFKLHCRSFVSLLQEKGIHVHDPADSLLKIAEHNNVPPYAVLDILQPQASRGMGPK